LNTGGWRRPVPAFQAVMVLASREIMGGGNVLSGEFAPQKPVTGAGAPPAIRKIREALH